MKKELQKGDFVRVRYVPSGIQGIEIGQIARVTQPTLKLGVNQGCRIKFLEADQDTHWFEENLELLNQKEVEALGDRKDWEKIEIQYLNPNLLKHHPLNEEIYGKNEDVEDLIESIRKTGQIQPLIINQRKEILSGNRRKKAAIALGISKVPVILKYYQEESQEIEELLTNNAYRIKTDLQLSKEAEFWERLEKEKARQRSRANLNNKSSKAIELGKNSQKGRASDIAARKAGITPKQHRNAKQVNAWLDRLRELKEFEEADRLEQLAEDKTVHAALSEISADPKYKQWKREQKISDLKARTKEKVDRVFPFEIGDICLIRAAGDKDLRPYQKLWGKVISLNNFSCQVLTYNCCLHNLGEENLRKAEHLTEQQKEKAGQVIQRANEIGSNLEAEPIAKTIARSLVSRDLPVIELSPLEHSLLSLCEEKAQPRLTIA